MPLRCLPQPRRVCCPGAQASKQDKTPPTANGEQRARRKSIYLLSLITSALIPLSYRLRLAKQTPTSQPSFLHPSPTNLLSGQPQVRSEHTEMDKIFASKDAPAIAIPLTVDAGGDADRKPPSVAACSCPICIRKSDSLVSNCACLPLLACRSPRVLTRTASTSPATTISMPQKTRSFTLTRRSATRMSPVRSLQHPPSTKAVGAPSPTSRSSISLCRHSPLPQ